MGNTDQSSGTYIIDKDYNIVSYNGVAKQLYPQLKKKEKCYKCLMGLNSPCPPCPVVNQVKGPKTYFDPIRKIYETVDAVPMVSEDGEEERFALIFSTTGEREKYSKQLPKTEEELNSLYEREYYDKMTGGYSQQGFIREVASVLENSGDEKYALVYLNICNFKAINALFGYEGGDALLVQTYVKIQKMVPDIVVFSRMSADRFVALIPQDKLDINYITENMNQKWTYKGKTVMIYGQAGIYRIEDKTMPVEGMLDRARLAKNSITEDLKSCIVFDEKMQRDYIDQAQVLADFEGAIEQEQFKVYYQPVVNARTGKVTSAEALVRWCHPEKGLIAPNRFISILEKNGFITKLDCYMAEHIFKTMKKRLEEHKKIVPVAINLSWVDLYDEDMKRTLRSMLLSEILPPGALSFEATETTLNSMEEVCGEYLAFLRSTGSKILLDDFGTGYSSFNMIQKYDFDILKIDREFICGIEKSVKTRNIICAIIAMCHELQIEVVAEGVETQVEYDFLQLNGCDYIQGFFVAKPMIEEDFYDYLDTSKRRKTHYLESLVDISHKAIPMSLGKESMTLQDLVLNYSDRFVQVCDPETHEMYYANYKTRQISGHPEEDYRGQKCYKYMLGTDKMCPHCPMRLMGDETERQLEVDDGSYTFALTARYINYRGKRLFMEVGMDITDQKNAKRKYDEQFLAILQSIPGQQGIFHMDLTLDKWISSTGNARNARGIQNVKNIDDLIRQVALFAPDKKDQEAFFQCFCRSSLLKAYEEGKERIVSEMPFYYDDRSVRWSRGTVQFLKNPVSEHIEAFLFGEDITEEKKQQKLREESLRLLKEVQDKYKKADYEKRVDFLTGLHNRLELFEHLKQVLEGQEETIYAMYMLDVDYFKAFNDTNGHLAGDNCLKQIATALKEYGKKNSLRFFRYGGEEILATYAGVEKSPHQIASELVQLIRVLKIQRSDQSNEIVTVSLGYTIDNSRYEKMIDKADWAMYQAKKNGRNCSCCYEVLRK